MLNLNLSTSSGADPTRVWWTPLVGLYHNKTDLLSCAAGGFSIINEIEGYRGETRIYLNQLSFSGTYDLPNLPLRFGVMF